MIGDFHFLRPLWLAALVPWAWTMWRLWSCGRSAGNWTRVCDPLLLPHLLDSDRRDRNPWPGRLVCMTGILAIIAIAGPTWERRPVPLYTETSALIVLLDLSRSMDTPDLPPDRLTRARYKLSELLSRRRDGLTGLIVFGGEAFLAAPLSDDVATVAHMLDGLDTSLMPVQGSQLGPALDLAGRMFAGAGIQSGTLLLVSDGGDPGPLVESFIAERPHQMHVLGVGTLEGAPIPVEDGYFEDGNGNIVVPRLDERRLQALARAGDGLYMRIGVDDTDVAALDAAMRPIAPDGELAEGKAAEYWQELGPWLLLPLLPLAALAFRRGYLVLVLGLVIPVPEADAFEFSSIWRNQDQLAYERLQSGDFDVAAELFDDPRWKAAALFRAGRWAESEAALTGLDEANDWYNRGNALVGADQIEAAITAYRTALERNPGHEDAAFNLRKLQELQRQQRRESGEPDDGAGDPDLDQDRSDRNTSGDSPDPRESDVNESGKSEGKGEKSDKDESKQSESDQPRDEGDKEKGESRSGNQSQQGEAGEQASSQAASRSGEGESGAAITRRTGQLSASEQWLRRIREDPAELLRRKFRHIANERAAEQPKEPRW